MDPSSNAYRSVLTPVVSALTDHFKAVFRQRGSQHAVPLISVPEKVVRKVDMLFTTLTPREGDVLVEAENLPVSTRMRKWFCGTYIRVVVMAMVVFANVKIEGCDQ